MPRCAFCRYRLNEPFLWTLEFPRLLPPPLLPLLNEPPLLWLPLNEPLLRPLPSELLLRLPLNDPLLRPVPRVAPLLAALVVVVLEKELAGRLFVLLNEPLLCVPFPNEPLLCVPFPNEPLLCVPLLCGV